MALETSHFANRFTSGVPVQGDLASWNESRERERFVCERNVKERNDNREVQTHFCSFEKSARDHDSTKKAVRTNIFRIVDDSHLSDVDVFAQSLDA